MRLKQQVLAKHKNRVPQKHRLGEKKINQKKNQKMPKSEKYINQNLNLKRKFLRIIVRSPHGILTLIS